MTLPQRGDVAPLTWATYGDEDPNETTWDTDEVIRWLDNDVGLYHGSRWTVTNYEAERAAEYLADIDWESYNDSIERANVDWDYVVAHIADEEE